MSRTANDGDTVHVNYTGKLENGSVFDSTEDRDPLEFELGAGRVIPGFEDAVRGMEVGQRKEVRIPASDAYGERRDDLEVQVPRSRLPDGSEVQVGQQMAVRVAPKQEAIARVTDLDEDSITLDLNHPLAGQLLIFDLELAGIE